MLIGSGGNSIETKEAYAMEGEFDMDQLAPTLKFNLPYVLSGQYSSSSDQVNITKLKKYDTVQLFFGEFNFDPGDVDTNYPGMTKIFDGYIQQIGLTKSKASFDYSITAFGTAGLCNSRNAFHQVTAGKELTAFFADLFDAANLTAVIPLRFLDISTGFLGIFIDGGKNVKEVIDAIKEKYAIIVTQSGDGYLNVFTPSFLLKNRTDSVLGQYAWNFDTYDNTVFEIDYGDITSDVNTVVVQGYPPSIGVAVDAIGVENMNGQVNYQGFERMDLVGTEACEKFAQEKLLELQRNYEVSFRTKYDPRFMVGQPFTMNDHDRYTGTEIFTIKKFSFRIDKEDVSCQITGFTHSLTVLPENIVISNTGVADVDIIGLRQKVENVNWGGFS